MDTEIVIALSAVVNAAIIIWLAVTTKRYADTTERISRANESTLEVLKTSLHGSVYTWAADLLSSKVLLTHRSNVFNNLPNFTGNYDEMPEDLKESFEAVCRTYDLVGIAGHNKMLPHMIIAKEWGDSIIKSYEACKRHIEFQRIQRGPMFCNNYSELYKEALTIWKVVSHNNGSQRTPNGAR